MGLFDHLFKAKSPTGEEKVDEPAVEAAPAAKPTEGGPRSTPPQRADPSAFLHPKSFVPRGAPGLTPAPRPGSGITGVIGKGPERRPSPGGAPASADEIVLTLGDVLSRIPTHYLKAGTHDAKRELRFKVNDLSSDIARGRAAVPLSRIAQLAPEIFVKGISRDEDTEVRLPLQKLVEQIGLLRSRPKAPVVEKMARPVTAVELPPGIKSVLPIPPKMELPSGDPTPVPTPAAPVPEALHSAPVPESAPPTPPIVFAEQTSVQKAVELKPSAEHAAATPVILGPPPAVAAPEVAVVPQSVVAPEPVIAPEAVVAPLVAVEPAPPMPAPAPVPILEVQPKAEALPPAPEPMPEPVFKPVPPVPAVPPAEPPAAAEPKKIVVDWGVDVPATVEESKAVSVPEIVIEPAHLEAAHVEPVHVEAAPIEPVHAEPTPVEAAHIEPMYVEPVSAERKLAPIESPELDPGEEKIHLSLAAILRSCPPEIIVGKLPHVDESVRITLPFAPIDRQLVKGQVEVSALRFIVALPDIYQKYFVAKVGVKVPIPLEEVFQNLPAPTHELTPAPPTPPPVVLAPAPPTISGAEIAPGVASLLQKLEEHMVVPTLPAERPLVTAPIFEAASTEPAEPLEAKMPEPVAAPVEPPPLPSAMAPEPAVPPYPAIPPPLVAIPPIIHLRENLMSEKTAPPPLSTVAEAASTLAEPPSIPTVAASSVPEPPPVLEPPPTEPPPAFVPPWMSAPPIMPSITSDAPPLDVPEVPPPVATVEAPVDELTPPVVSIPPGVANARPSSDEAPRLALQPPVFRPHFAPPPIFGFTPAPVGAESEPVTKPEPPSVLAGLAGSPAPVLAPASEHPGPETVSPVSEAAVTPAPAEAPVVPAEPPPLPAAASDAEPSDELVALAGEHSAPDIVSFSDEPVPFTDLAQSLAHETTYAPALAEVVHVDMPDAGSGEAKAPIAAEITAEQPAAVAPVAPEKPVAVEEHHAVPIMEGLAVAAVAATITEHPLLHVHEVDALVGEPQASEPAGAHLEAPAPAEPKVEEPVVSEHPAVEAPVSAAEMIPPADVSSAEAPTVELPSMEVPVPPVVEPPAAVKPPPPPHPLFPVPKLPSEPAHLEVLLPSSLPLRRFDQDALQALFMTEETLDLPKVSRLAAGLPGVYACVIATRDQACTGGTLPDGFDLAALLGLAPRVGEAAGRMPIGQLKHFTLYGDAYSVSFFERNGLSLCAVHRPRSFVPGVREKLVALADELSR